MSNVTRAAPIALVAVLSSAEAQAQLSPGCTALGGALVEHSCFHSKFGPFVSVQAIVGQHSNDRTPNVDLVHTEHRVGLGQPGEPHVVTYTPDRSGAWIVFTSFDIPLQVLPKGGEALGVAFEQNGDTGCDALPRARVYEIEAGQRYELRLGPSEESSVVLVIEYGSDFLAPAGVDADGDGHGDPTQTQLTNCIPPAGYAANAGDCNDADPTIHPGATELCDDIDRNCNGSATDEGLQCRAGTGACIAIGKFTCDEGSIESRCDAVPLPAVSEVCNGVDDDCDGSIDNGGPLCISPDAPTCARSDLGAFCGCLLDLDCTAGGHTKCDPATRTCFTPPIEDAGAEDAGEAEDAGTQDATMLEPDSGSTNVPTEQEPDSGVTDEPAPPEPDAGKTFDRPVGDSKTPDDASDDVPRSRADPGCSCQLPGAPTSRTYRSSLALLAAAAVLRRKRARPGRLYRSSALALFVLPFVGIGCGAQSTDDNPLQRTSPNAHEGLLEQMEDEPAVPQPNEACMPELALTPIKHSCTHAKNGKFITLAAAASEGSGPSTDEVHATYLVEPVADIEVSHLSYTPSRDGMHVLFTDQPASLRVSEMAGQALEPTFEGPVEGCPELAFGLAVELSQGTTYDIELGSVGSPPLLLFFEHLQTFGERAWASTCPE